MGGLLWVDCKFRRFLIYMYSTCNFVYAHHVSESRMKVERMESATIPDMSLAEIRKWRPDLVKPLCLNQDQAHKLVVELVEQKWRRHIFLLCNDNGKYSEIVWNSRNYCGSVDQANPLSHRDIGFKSLRTHWNPIWRHIQQRVSIHSWNLEQCYISVGCTIAPPLTTINQRISGTFPWSYENIIQSKIDLS